MEHRETHSKNPLASSGLLSRARPMDTRHAYIKIIAWVVIFLFTWSQIAYSAGDLFYFNPATPAAAKSSLRVGDEVASSTPGLDKSGLLSTPGLGKSGLRRQSGSGKQTETDEIEVTNYDLFHYEKKENPVHKLLPSMKEQEQTSGFAPNYLKRQQNKHEDVVRQKGVIDSLLENLFNKRKPREEAEVPLKKKKSGPEGQSGKAKGGYPEYTLTDPPNDAPKIPGDLNEYIYGDKILQRIITFNITRIDIDRWKRGAEEKTDDDGEKYWIAYDTDEGLPGEERITKAVVFTGEGDDRKVDYMLWGTVCPGGKAEYYYRSDYERSGDDMTNIKVYDVRTLSEEESEKKGQGKLTQWTVFGGTGEDNKAVQHRYYSDGALYLRVDIEGDVKTGYDTTRMEEGEARKERGTGIKLFETLSRGETGKENDDYTYYFNSEEEITSTTVLIYVNGKRAGEADDNDPIAEEITYRGDAIAKDEYEADGNLLEGEDGIKDDAVISSITINDTYRRNQDEKVAILTYIYAEDGKTIQQTIIYVYESGRTGEDANYTENIKIKQTFRGDPVSDGVDENGDGVSDDDLDQDGIKDDAILEKEDYFDVEDIKGRVTGEAVLDYTLNYEDGTRYNSANKIVTTTIVYYYLDQETGKVNRAKTARESDNNDPLYKTETYKRNAIAIEGDVDEDGDGIKDSSEKLLETYYKGMKGSEISDYSYSFDSQGEIAFTSYYFYNYVLEEITYRVRAENAFSTALMFLSVTYNGEKQEDYAADTYVGESTYILDDIKTAVFYHTGDYNGAFRIKGEEVADYALNYDNDKSVEDTTVYFYGNVRNRAKSSSAYACLKQTNIYRKKVNDIGAIARDTLSDSATVIKTLTSYHIDGRTKGKEVADYTLRYRKDTAVKETTIYNYSANYARAENAGSDDCMSKASIYRGDNHAVIDDSGLLSETFYYITGKIKGEEIADYTEDNKSGRTSYYVYEDLRTSPVAFGVRAKLADTGAKLIKSIIYRSGMNEDDATAGVYRSISHYEGDKGEERVYKTVFYRKAGNVIKSTTIYTYETSGDGDANLDGKVDNEDFAILRSIWGLRFGDAGFNENADFDNDGIIGSTDINILYANFGKRINSTVNFAEQRLVTTETFKDYGLVTQELSSITYYYLSALIEKGEEIADYSYNYKAGPEEIVKTTSVYFYNDARAEDANPEDAMNKSESYKGEGVVEANIQSTTFYLGEKGEEIADYSLNYKTGERSTVKTTSVRR